VCDIGVDSFDTQRRPCGPIPMTSTTRPSSQSDASPKRPRLRWPIYLQLLIPTVAVVLLASLLATTITVLWIAQRVRNEQSENLRRVGETLSESAYPLTKSVLQQISGYSRAEFVLLTSNGRLQESTLSTEQPWLEDLARIAQSHRTGEDAEHVVVSLGERNYLVDFVSVTNRPHTTEPATLFILYPEDQLASRIRQAVSPALIAGLVAAGIAVAMATWLARRFTRPIRTLVVQTATIAHGDFTPMPVSPRNDELRDLAESINRMTTQLAEHQRQVRHNERLRTLGQLGASMAHQLRNAATGGRMAVELHRRDCPQGAADESLDVALRQFQLMESYLRQFLSLGQAAPAVRQRVHLASLVEEVLRLVRPSCVHAGIDLQFTAPGDCPTFRLSENGTVPFGAASAEPVVIEGDAESLRQLVTNLVLNAVDAAVTGSAVPPRVAVELAQTDAGGKLCVRDTGPGPDPSIHDQLFHSFVTTKPDGFGLGLFVARQIAERHGGRLDWRRDGDMTCFSFEFPLAT
jgi:signal transduction histidine kinase